MNEEGLECETAAVSREDAPEYAETMPDTTDFFQASLQFFFREDADCGTRKESE